uniref:Neurotransmitter-gated ion-channel ligand-binding domain-containing protein n=1 Tax=Anopheles arabiensis TaxID=7173 RepID=A0A182HU34_ANOAR
MPPHIRLCRAHARNFDSPVGQPADRCSGWTWPKMGSVLLTAVFIALQFATGLANPDSKRLYDDLLSNYNRLIRPVGNNSDRLTVKMGLRLSQLIDVGCCPNAVPTTESVSSRQISFQLWP